MTHGRFILMLSTCKDAGDKFGGDGLVGRERKGEEDLPFFFRRFLKGNPSNGNQFTKKIIKHSNILQNFQERFVNPRDFP